MGMRFSHLVALLGFVAAHLASMCSGCSCALSSFAEKFYLSQSFGGSFANATVLATSCAQSPTRWHCFGSASSFSVSTRSSENCSAPTPYYTVAKSSIVDGASCGIDLSLNEAYILPLYTKRISFVSSCNIHQKTSTLSAVQLQFLNSRPACCNGKCSCPNADKVQCIRSPCDPRFEKPPCAEAENCVSNYCGGCSAEWFTASRRPACQPDPFKRPLTHWTHGEATSLLKWSHKWSQSRFTPQSLKDTDTYILWSFHMKSNHRHGSFLRILQFKRCIHPPLLHTIIFRHHILIGSNWIYLRYILYLGCRQTNIRASIRMLRKLAKCRTNCRNISF